MEVISKGKLPSEETYRGTCNNCNAIVRAKAGELVVTHDQRDYTFGSAACPECGQSMTFYPEGR